MKPEWFSTRLQEVRTAAGLTQAELAERAGLTREGIAQLETGRRKPAWETVLALCAALGVDCTVFTKEPNTPAAAPRPGRPKKKREGPSAKKDGGEPKG